jgi:hypothetical protein
MAPRLQLHELLETFGAADVYFQPPATTKMVYPAIVYKRDTEDLLHANNLPYHREKRYSVTVIDRNPDSDIPGKVAALPKCRFDRFFTADNLNHDVYQLFF